MGHELTHGFDDAGSHFDAYGVMTDWWSPSVRRAFKKKTKCMVNQYAKIQVPGVPSGVSINGELTLGENIADNGGAGVAMQAYLRWAAKNGAPTRFKLGGETFTAEQLFWLVFAQTWCTLYRPHALMQRIKRDEHSPAAARVNGVVQNSASFASAYKCPKGSPMNPEAKCKVW